ncbi:tRNA dihydrouridine synthase, partial [Coemansia sp. RSA 1804]
MTVSDTTTATTVALPQDDGTTAPAHFTMTEDEIKAKFPTRLRGYDLFRKMNSPRHIVAPMVDQSELAWRILSRNHGAELCYTPMFHAKFFGDANPKYRNEHWVVMAEGEGIGRDRPVVVQFCANDPDTLLRAARFVVGDADA